MKFHLVTEEYGMKMFEKNMLEIITGTKGIVSNRRVEYIMRNFIIFILRQLILR
jgi:hypothetical protein